MTTSPWTVPDSYPQHVSPWPGSDVWLPTLPEVAARWAETWQLTPDGAPLHGWTGVVWPVRDSDDRPLMLKVSPPVRWTASESLALAALAGPEGNPLATASGSRMIRAIAVNVPDRVVLLPRLDPARSLEDHPDIDEAVTVIADVIAGIGHVAPIDGVPRLVDELDTLEPNLVVGGGIDQPAVDRARGRLAELRQVLADPERLRLLHGDCHFLNVLHTVEPDPPAWIGIDPAPLVGVLEWEPTPMLRNRWAAAVASGAPDRALRRRVDQFCEVTGADPELVRACAQIQSVAAVAGWPIPATHLHHPPYVVMAQW